MKVAGAGNVEVPSYLALIELGYKVDVVEGENKEHTWTATKNKETLIGSGPLELLGLIKMIELRGQNWKATDEQIEGFVKKYC